MSWTDRITVLVAAGAIVATLSVGTCSTNGRFDDVNRRIDDVNRRIDDVQTDIRELRIEAIKTNTADEANSDAAAN